MKKDNFRAVRGDPILLKQKKQYFIGKVVLHDVSKIIRTQEQKMYHVTFRNGAKTKLHYHESGQTLIITEGKGFLVMYKRIKQSAKKILKIRPIFKVIIKKGDIVYIPKRTLHWHGCSNNGEKLSHIAINSHTSIGKEAKTIWFNSDFKTLAKKID